MASTDRANNAGIVASVRLHLYMAQSGQPLPAATGMVRTLDYGGLLRQLAAQSGYSPRTLHRIIAHWLHQPPPLAGEFSAARHLILDGTFLDRRKGV